MFGTVLNSLQCLVQSSVDSIAMFGTILSALQYLVQSSVHCNNWYNPQCIAMLPQVVVQVLSQLQETSHHDALQNGDGHHLVGGDDVNHRDH